MRRRYIRLLSVIMTATVVLLILVQAAWIENAAIIEEQEFSKRVNKALYEVVKTIEVREALLQITQSSVPFSNDSNELSGSKFLFEENFVEDRNNSVDTGNISQNIYYLKGDSLYKIDAGTQDSSNKYDAFTQKDLRERIIGNISKKTIFIQDIINRMISAEIGIEKRLDAVQLENVIKNSFELNNIDYPYFYAVKDEFNEFSFKSEGFSLDYVKQTYEIKLFPNDILSSGYYLVVYFRGRDGVLFGNIPREMIISLIITVIITITFAFIIYLILKQRKLSELKNDFINNMTHELKTPVSTISLASQMLSDRSINIDKNELSSVTKIIGDESRRLEFQIEKVLQISLFEKGNIHFNIQEVDLHNIIQKAVMITDIKVRTKGGIILTDLNAKQYTVQGDKLHLTNIFFNLLDNAVKYSNIDKPPRIKVGSELNSNSIQITISDNGVGITKENQKKIFNKFYRVPTGNLHDAKGFGLGLSYVKRIIDEHKGTISVKSEIDSGTEFSINLPLSNL